MLDLKLKENQLIATTHKDGPMMVLAGPGSGKTTVITYRIKYLTLRCNIAPSSILVISFTKASQIEMKNRYIKLFGDKENINFTTFHAFFYRVLNNYYNYSIDNILKDFEQRDLIKNIVKSKKISIEEEDNFISNIINEIGLIKNNILDINYYNSINIGSDLFKEIYIAYENYKQNYNKIDFDDMLIKCYNLISENKTILTNLQQKYKYILIDEFQDINKVQFESIKLIAMPQNNIFVVGDDDQSIYKFRGADPEFLLRFPDAYKDTKKIILNTNHRSTDEIITFCNKVITQNKLRYVKGIVGDGKSGLVPTLFFSKDITDEAYKVSEKINAIISQGGSFKETAVLYRNNIQSRSFIDAFRLYNIPFHVKDEVPSIYDHWIAKDLLSYFKLALDINNNECFERIINKPKRYIGLNIISSAKKIKGDSLFEKIFKVDNLNKWTYKNLYELKKTLLAIKIKNPHTAIKYLRKITGYDDYLRSFSEYLGVNSKGMFEVLEELQEAGKGFDTLVQYIENAKEMIAIQKNQKIDIKNSDLDSVTLSTLHSAKGLEYDNVFVTSVVEGVIPSEKSKESEIEEECRLLYVGMTRARYNLYISILKTRYDSDVDVSRFLKNFIKGAKKNEKQKK